MPSPVPAPIRQSSNAPVMQAGGEVVGGPLLTVREVAERRVQGQAWALARAASLSASW